MLLILSETSKSEAGNLVVTRCGHSSEKKQKDCQPEGIDGRRLLDLARVGSGLILAVLRVGKLHRALLEG